MKIIFLIIFLVVNVYGVQQRVDPLVLIRQGLVRGQKSTDGDYSAFLGIPYAKVNLDDPFGTAQPASQFEEEIFYAYDNSKVCPQTSNGFPNTASENEDIDCLQLSLYVPSQASSRNPLPVLVWIHGGGFAVGSGNQQGPSNLLKHSIIVVTVNYRLGPYGFMCLNNPALPGNQGLKDQYTALRWIRENIAAFGGNPYNVTLGGFSAGSASVLYQLYSSKDKLFNKIIAESGTHRSPDMFGSGDYDAAIKLANYLGLNTTNEQQALNFLAATHHSLVTGAASDLELEFLPCKENSFSDVDNFIDNEPSYLSNTRKIRNTPVLIGNTDLEYLGDVKNIHGEDYFSKDFFRSRLQQVFNLEGDQLETAAAIVRHFYIGDRAITTDVNDEAEYLNSDFVFNHPIQDTITSLINENAKPVYEYVFSYVGDSGAAGAGHSAEIPYLFNLPGYPALRSTDDQLISDRMTSLWANFIKYGNPTRETSDLIPVNWTPVTEDTRPYLNIGPELRMQDRFLRERMAFWDLLYSSYGQMVINVA